MEPLPRILHIDEVASLLRVSIPTINRWIRQARNGERDFPIPIGPAKSRGRWLSSDIEAFLQSETISKNAIPSNVGNPAKRQKKETKAFEQRQKEARRVLDAHRNPQKQEQDRRPEN